VNYPWERLNTLHQQGLWGTSVGVEATSEKNHLPDSAYPGQLKGKEPSDVKLTFNKGN
jgi:argininosuccinate synthase